MPRALNRLALALTATLAAALLFAPSALAHATLEGTSPPRGATAKQQPSAVVFRFSEPVEGNFGAVRVYDVEGERADAGDAFHPGGEGQKLGVHLKPGLPDGSYTATYRVVSADGHIVSGGYVFSIGKAGRAPEETVAELVAGRDAGTATEIGMGIARGVQYAALAVALGALAFLLLAWRPARRLVAGDGERWQRAGVAFERRLRLVLLAAAAAGAVSAAAAVVFEAAQAAGISATAALDSTILREELGTRFGTVWGFTALAWVLLGLGVVPALRRLSPWRIAPLFVPLAFIVLEPALSGHPSTQSPVALLFPANVLHVAAMSVWVGGLASLVLILPAATRELEAPRSQPPDRGDAGALLADRAGRRRRDPAHRHRPGIRLRPRPRQPPRHRLRPRGPNQVRPPRRRADPPRRLQPLPLGSPPRADRGGWARRPAAPGCCCVAHCAARSP